MLLHCRSSIENPGAKRVANLWLLGHGDCHSRALPCAGPLPRAHATRQRPVCQDNVRECEGRSAVDVIECMSTFIGMLIYT